MKLLTLRTLTLPAAAVLVALLAGACDSASDDDAPDSGGASSGGTSSASGGAQGGDGGQGGGGQAGETCTSTEPGAFCISACLSEDGPTAAVRGASHGAFTEDQHWMDDWTNWSIDSSNLSTAQLALREEALDPDNAATHVLASDIAADKTLTADQAWVISGTVHVLDGVTLTIEPGTLVIGDNSPAGTLVISRGGKIMAEGTAEAPIIMTSAMEDGDRGKGQWGGLVLLGRADNFVGPNVPTEGLALDPLNQHGEGAGAVDDTWDCGSLAYLRIEFVGVDLNADSLSLAVSSCGSQTSIHHVEVNSSLENGFDFFGGQFDAHHLVVNDAGDDMFDFDLGWRGTLDTFFGRQIVPTTDDPHGFEWDSSNTGGEPGNLPVTNAHAKNGTLCGTGKPGKPNFGAVLRERITGSLDNLAIVGFDAAFDVRDNFLENGTGPGPKVTIENSAIWGNRDGIAHEEDPTQVAGTQACIDEPLKYLCDDDLAFDEAAWFTAGSGNASLDP